MHESAVLYNDDSGKSAVCCVRFVHRLGCCSQTNSPAHIDLPSMGHRNLMRCSEPSVFAGSQVPPAMPPAAHTSVRRGLAGPPVPAVSAHKVPDLRTAAADIHCQDSAAVDTRQVVQVA